MVPKDQIQSIVKDHYGLAVDSVDENGHSFDLRNSRRIEFVDGKKVTTPNFKAHEGVMKAYELEAEGRKLLLVEYPEDLLTDENLMQWFKDVVFMEIDGRRNWELIDPLKPSQEYYLFDTGLRV